MRATITEGIGAHAVKGDLFGDNLGNDSPDVDIDIPAAQSTRERNLAIGHQLHDQRHKLLAKGDNGEIVHTRRLLRRQIGVVDPDLEAEGNPGLARTRHKQPRRFSQKAAQTNLIERLMHD